MVGRALWAVRRSLRSAPGRPTLERPAGNGGRRDQRWSRPAPGVPISGMAGDQHAALFGQCCFDAGDTKVTYGTGSFVLVNAGTVLPDPQDGLLTTLAWDLGDGEIAYALEGSVFVSGAGVQWLRDGLGVIERADETEALARSVASSAGLVIVPAFTGLGSPTGIRRPGAPSWG